MALALIGAGWTWTDDRALAQNTGDEGGGLVCGPDSWGVVIYNNLGSGWGYYQCNPWIGGWWKVG